MYIGNSYYIKKPFNWQCILGTGYISSFGYLQLSKILKVICARWAHTCSERTHVLESFCLRSKFKSNDLPLIPNNCYELVANSRPFLFSYNCNAGGAAPRTTSYMLTILCYQKSNSSLNWIIKWLTINMSVTKVTRIMKKKYEQNLYRLRNLVLYIFTVVFN